MLFQIQKHGGFNNIISGSIQYYQWKYTVLSREVYKTISGSKQYYQQEYTILSAEV